MTKLRTWLENNKVFFETIAAILISLMALLVSWSQLNASRVQNNLARLQTRISEQSVMPHFVINAKQLKGSPQNSTFDEDKLTIDYTAKSLRQTQDIKKTYS